MTENTTDTETNDIQGQMFLYEKPELLTPEAHGQLGLTPQDNRFENTRDARAIPLTVVEFGSAQRHYPIVFSSLEKPVPLAALGVLDTANLFVDDSGRWDSMAYVPAYLQCYPFTLAQDASGRMAVVVDTAASSVTENPTYPFFVDGKISEQADKLMRLVTQYEGERTRTQEFCAKLVELELLTSLRAAHTPEGAEEQQLLAEYISIDAQKVTNLPAETVYELHKSGFLSAIYMQLYSLENWRHLVARRELGQKAAA